MGRYYYGDIEGKFWFAVQDSNDADNYGVEGKPYKYYYCDKCDESCEDGNKDDYWEDTEECKHNWEHSKTVLQYSFFVEDLPTALTYYGAFKRTLRKLINNDTDFNKIIADLESGESQGEYPADKYDNNTCKKIEKLMARIELGHQIIECINKTDYCCFEAEF